jgi:hypothetical protein
LAYNLANAQIYVQMFPGWHLGTRDCDLLHDEADFVGTINTDGACVQSI